MIPKIIQEKILLKDGRTIILETGKLARQANGSVVVRLGNTMLLATVVIAKKIKEGVDFLPLIVDYREKYSAGGKIPGGFFKREGRPSDEEILTMRLVDRVLRPLFPKNFYKEIQIMISLLSYDKDVLPDNLAGLAASAALTLSKIPFNGPISEVRIIRIDNKFIINPGIEQLKKANLDLVVGASKDSIIMVEGEMKEVSEFDLINAIKEAHKDIILQIDAQCRLLEQLNLYYPKKKYEYIEEEINNSNLDLKEKLLFFSKKKLNEVYKKKLNKQDRSIIYDNILKEFKNNFSNTELEEYELLIDQYFAEIQKELFRNNLLKEGIRLDGRTYKEIRPIWCEVDCLPCVHGSALFSRGETQSLTTITLGSSLDVNKIDNALMEDQEKFYIHYNFMPFSTREIRTIRGVSRREIGHGNLAKRALKNVIPTNIPYTIRVVSDILESNGSSSMATVCASSLALMDAGISIVNPVAGIAMGLIIDNITGKYIILSDILGDEDHIGDMDLKITGTNNGITSCQMDIKINGLSYKILEKAILQAKEGYLYILHKMLNTIHEPRKNLKPNAPKIYIFNIPKKFIGSVIGPNGRIIQKIQVDTNTSISIEEKENLGVVEILGKESSKIEDAVNKIKKIVFIPEVGKIYNAKVKSIREFGAFLELSKGIEGLLHISEIEHKRLRKVEDVLKIGDEIKVKLLDIDKKNGKIRLSRKILLPNKSNY
ncbi:MAG: polyribonucleotide nucleotidyltransferase [Candidatus Bostrichicola ureolyticus]|nr:MAG: polyribonucleotide nucleotidyltransferase [Candidatus Bostrichicola ureolyticus]